MTEQTIRRAKHDADNHQPGNVNIIRAGETYEPPPGREGFVYVVKPAGHNVYKIGCSVDVERRLARMQRKYDFSLELVAVIYSKDYERLEAQMHRRFAKYHLIGEWFVLPDSAIEYLKGLTS